MELSPSQKWRNEESYGVYYQHMYVAMETVDLLSDVLL